MKGNKRTESVNYLLRIMKEQGLSYQKLASTLGTSSAYLHQAMKRGEPLTLQRAIQLAEGAGLNTRILLNLVFKDRLVRFLEKENLLSKGPTPEVRKIVKIIQDWDPEKGDLIRYIMSTLAKCNTSQYTNENNPLGGVSRREEQLCLTAGVRLPFFVSDQK